MEPRLRWIAADVAELLQEAALPVWREMTGLPSMGPHAKFALFTMGAGPEPDDGEWLWLAVESAAVALAERGPNEAVIVLWEALPAERWRQMTSSTAWPWSGQPIIRRHYRSGRPSRTSSRPPDRRSSNQQIRTAELKRLTSPVFLGCG